MELKDWLTILASIVVELGSLFLTPYLGSKRGVLRPSRKA